MVILEFGPIPKFIPSFGSLGQCFTTSPEAQICCCLLLKMASEGVFGLLGTWWYVDLGTRNLVCIQILGLNSRMAIENWDPKNFGQPYYTIGSVLRPGSVILAFFRSVSRLTKPFVEKLLTWKTDHKQCWYITVTWNPYVSSTSIVLCGEAKNE